MSINDNIKASWECATKLGLHAIMCNIIHVWVGIALMHIADRFTRRKYDKKERISKSEEEYQRKEGKQCHTCGDYFDSEMALEDHIKRKHWEHQE